MRPNALLIDSRDNVVTVLQDILPGGIVAWSVDDQIAVHEGISAGHKVAIKKLSAGAIIRKYGYPIGVASDEICAGDRIHTHNLNAVEA